MKLLILARTALQFPSATSTFPFSPTLNCSNTLCHADMTLVKSVMA